MALISRRSVTIGAIAALAVGAAAAGWLGYRLLRSGRPTLVIAQPSPVTPAGVERLGDFERCTEISDGKQRDECQQVGFYVWLSQHQRAVQKSGDIKECDALFDAENRDQCRRYFVGNNYDERICQQMELAENQEGCRSFLLSRGDDLPACTKLNDPQEQKFCIQQVVGNNQKTGPSFCDRVSGTLRRECLEAYWINEATSRVDYDLCRKIAEPEGVARCLKLMPADTDSDGLSDYYERAFSKTDPADADSDDDGFTDGVELKSGHNPKGPGKLPEK